MTSVFIFVSKLETDIYESFDATYSHDYKNVGQKTSIMFPLLSH